MTSRSIDTRCGARRSDGRLCTIRGEKRHGGRCWWHAGARPGAAVHAPATLATSRCKTLNANGWPCLEPAEVGSEHCARHTRAERHEEGLAQQPGSAHSSSRCSATRVGGGPCFARGISKLDGRCIAHADGALREEHERALMQALARRGEREREAAE